jgi:predicted nucleic acid-binding protein
VVLVDTSIWIDHFRKGNPDLEYLLSEFEAATHPYIIGELLCGNFRNRTAIHTLIAALPVVPEVTQEEYCHFIERHELFGRGLGFVDVHLLAAATVSHARLFTRDKCLLSAASGMNIAYTG